jgi:hypothetical protein
MKTKKEPKPRIYMGCTINRYPRTGLYYAFTSNGSVRADTVAGIKEMIREREKPAKKKPAESTRARKWVGLLSNHVSRDDDETVDVWAKTYEEAERKVLAKMDTSRFSLRTVMTAKDARGNWA